jgi:hypothetical protein
MVAHPAVKSRWHQLASAVQDSNLPASDKSVFLYLLGKADFKTAELTPKFTPTREQIARKTSLSYSQVGYSTRHLRRHGWLTAGGATGPGHPLEYGFAVGAACDCTGRVHARKRCQPDGATVPTDDPRSLPTDGANAAGGTGRFHERHREEGVGGRDERKPEPEPEPSPEPETDRWHRIGREFVEIMAATGPDPWE